VTKPISVLLIDDEAIYLESLARVLKKRGMEVATAQDGPTGILALEKGEYDAIVLDMRMPGMDGLATLEEIRRRDTLTPVIILTGYMDLERVIQALKEGAEEILLKPCPIDILISSIENASERKNISRQIEDNVKWTSST
jgi:DNA-binding NtrC family response regulator